jgi:hypothetical protein
MAKGQKVFRFEYSDDSPGYGEFADYKDIQMTLRYDDAITWDVVLKDFVQFLGNAWGYDISDQVEIANFRDKISNLLDDLYDPSEDAYDEEESSSSPKV